MARILLTANRKAVRNLALTFVLSFVNLGGAFLVLVTLGGLEPWTDAQFVGLFGLIEFGLGLAFMFAPNVWRLPVSEANTSDRTAIRLAATEVLIPHWTAVAKALGGALMLGYAAVAEGISPATAALLPVAILIAVAFLCVAALAARVGVARPDVDVYFVAIRRPGRREWEMPGISISGIVVQFIGTTGVFPAVLLLSPSVLYRPEFTPSMELMEAVAGATAVLVLATWLAWRGRIGWSATREQQRETEAELRA